MFLNNLLRKNHLSEVIESVVGVTTTSQEANLLILLSTCSNCLFSKKDNAFSKKTFQDISYCCWIQDSKDYSYSILVAWKIQMRMKYNRISFSFYEILKGKPMLLNIPYACSPLSRKIFLFHKNALMHLIIGDVFFLKCLIWTLWNVSHVNESSSYYNNSEKFQRGYLFFKEDYSYYI